MDIRNWPVGRIMQLPDWCFGQRYPVCCNPQSYNDALGWDISEISLPESFVLWEFLWDNYAQTGAGDYIRVALGDQLPTSHAMFMLNEPLIQGLGEQGAEPREIHGYFYSSLHIHNIRKHYKSSSRRLVCECYAAADKSNHTNIVIVVSPVPTEVPDWLVLKNED